MAPGHTRIALALLHVVHAPLLPLPQTTTTHAAWHLVAAALGWALWVAAGLAPDTVILQRGASTVPNLALCRITVSGASDDKPAIIVAALRTTGIISGVFVMLLLTIIILPKSATVTALRLVPATSCLPPALLCAVLVVHGLVWPELTCPAHCPSLTCHQRHQGCPQGTARAQQAGVGQHPKVHTGQAAWSGSTARRGRGCLDGLCPGWPDPGRRTRQPVDPPGICRAAC